MFTRKKLPCAVLLACAFSSYSVAEPAQPTAAADKPAPAKTAIILAPVVVTATRQATDSFDLPVAIDLVEQDKIQDGQAKMTLSESLIRVPGITAQSRTQMAQDPQISTRGFGARSAFGVRGVRVYVDGIPLTMPDGQGQPGIVDLGVVKGIEVMRGPFSALYGNSSGGVIQMLTEDAPRSPELSGGLLLGSYNTHQETLRAAGTEDGMEYLLNYSQYSSDGYRDRSANEKKQGTAKFRFNLNEDTQLTTLVNWFEQDAQDPLGLTRAQAFSQPKSVVDAAINARTQVSRSHTQVGFKLDHQVNEHNAVVITNYLGTRENEQLLPRNALGTLGRTSQISREFWGMDARWDNRGMLLGQPYTFSLGTTYGRMEDDRTDTNTASGSNVGILNRDEKNIARNFDQYAQAKWSVRDDVDLHLGVRRTKISLDIDDQLINNGSGDNSGGVSYRKTTPVIGAVWKLNPAFSLYANYGTGFETPTFIEVAFANPANTSTPNLRLKPSESRNFEVGAKAFLSDNTRANLSLFKITTDDEIVLDNNVNGIATYANANKTSRNGAELSIESQLPHNVTLYGAYTLLNAKFDSDFTTASGNTITAGNVIPGTYHTQIYAEAAWKHVASGFRTAIEARHNSKAYVNDTNTDSAPSYTIFNLRAGFEQKLQNWRFSQYLRVENIFDKNYIGSVRVNDGNARFFEPAAGTNWLLGLNATYRF